MFLKLPFVIEANILVNGVELVTTNSLQSDLLFKIEVVTIKENQKFSPLG